MSSSVWTRKRSRSTPSSFKAKRIRRTVDDCSSTCSTSAAYCLFCPSVDSTLPMRLQSHNRTFSLPTFSAMDCWLPRLSIIDKLWYTSSTRIRTGSKTRNRSFRRSRPAYQQIPIGISAATESEPIRVSSFSNLQNWSLSHPAWVFRGSISLPTAASYGRFQQHRAPLRLVLGYGLCLCLPSGATSQSQPANAPSSAGQTASIAPTRG